MPETTPEARKRGKGGTPMAGPSYNAQDNTPHVVSPMEELAGLRGRHEGLMKEHTYLRDELAGQLRETNARLESENHEMGALLQYLRDLHPATGNGNIPPDQVAVVAVRAQMEVERQQREAMRRKEARGY